MKNKLSRREILKLATLLPLAYYTPTILKGQSRPSSNPNAPNILIIVFDAWSAINNSIYGYPRETTPNLERLAENAVVFHNHYAGGPHTTPGTATLLTGALPWTHRAFNKRTYVTSPFDSRNIFGEFDDYYRIGYTHNPFAETYFYQFQADLEKHIPRQELYLEEDFLVSRLLHKDFDIADLSRGQIFNSLIKPTTNSLYLSQLYRETVQKGRTEIAQSHKEIYPLGLPSIHRDLLYLLEDGIEWLGTNLTDLPQPFIGYFHFLPPHNPYHTRREFINVFRGGWQPMKKPDHLFTMGQSETKMVKERRLYDEYIPLVDSEFNRLMGLLKDNRIRDNTWIVVTSDHGEMFERGIMRHSHKTLHEPVIKIPLIIFPPGQQERIDIYERSSAVDVLPTLLHVTGREVPEWCEGVVLPPFADAKNTQDRSVYAVHLRGNPQYGPAAFGTLNIYKEQYKLMYFFGHEELPKDEPLIELYDLKTDPEEINNLYPTKKGVGEELFEELMATLQKAEEPYT
jgi:arylsulfatase A-like enzyme